MTTTVLGAFGAAMSKAYPLHPKYSTKMILRKKPLVNTIKYERGCNNKMFVRADLMPHHIRITNIRVERLQDICEEDCLKEGLWRDDNVGLEGTTYWYHGLANSSFRTAKEAYAALIDKISGKGTWESNPWVFVYNFYLVK